jgi:hypothetical protein
MKSNKLKEIVDEALCDSENTITELLPNIYPQAQKEEIAKDGLLII